MMTMLAEVSDKIVSPGQIWAVMGVVAAVLGAIALISRSWGVMVPSIAVSALGCWFTLSFFDDPVLGDAVFKENGWSWFASNGAASMLPVVAVIIGVMWSRRPRHQHVGFEVLDPDRRAAR